MLKVVVVDHSDGREFGFRTFAAIPRPMADANLRRRFPGRIPRPSADAKLLGRTFVKFGGGDGFAVESQHDVGRSQQWHVDVGTDGDRNLSRDDPKFERKIGLGNFQ